MNTVYPVYILWLYRCERACVYCALPVRVNIFALLVSPDGYNKDNSGNLPL